MPHAQCCGCAGPSSSLLTRAGLDMPLVLVINDTERQCEGTVITTVLWRSADSHLAALGGKNHCPNFTDGEAEHSYLAPTRLLQDPNGPIWWH